MKFAKRLLSAVLVCSVLLTCFVVMPVSAAFTDVKDTDRNAQAITVLNKLGIINGYDDGTFKPNNNVTRAEFTAMLLRTRGMGTVGSTSLENPPFPDVTTPDVSWAIANIRTAREMGIINGYDDGTFKPNNNVTYQEAVKMIVCALGYGEMGVEGAEWYTRYMVSAQTIGFTDGSGGVINTPATRETIAVMLYNCLEVNLAENNKVTDKTILENDLKLTKNVGYIDATPEISLSKADSNLRDDEVQITVKKADGTLSTDTYKTDNAAQYADMLGAQITFYYNVNRSTNFNTLLFATVKHTETFEINASQINDMDGTSIEYYRSENSSRTVVANIASDSVVVYNNRLFGVDKTTSTFDAYYTACLNNSVDPIPSIGKIKLLDRDNDNKYDVVFIDSYEAWFVSAATSSNKTVTDNVLRNGLTNEEKKLVLDTPDSSTQVTIRKMDGTEASFSSISKGKILCVKKSNPGNGGVKVIEVVVCDKTVSGKITATNAKAGVTIGGVTYQFSRQAPWKENRASGSTGIAEPVQGDGGKFYLDIDGNIITYDKTEETANQMYGYIIGANYENDTIEGETFRVQIYDEKGKSNIYTVDNRTKIKFADQPDITTISGVKDHLNLGTDDAPVYSQLIKFTTAASRGSNVLDEIVTATDSAEKLSNVPANVLNRYSNITSSDPLKYTRANKQLSKSGQAVNLHNAIIIQVPPVEERTNPSKYRKLSHTDFKEGDNNSYQIEAFDMSTTNAAKVVLVYNISIEVGAVDTESPVLVITEEPVWEQETGRWTISGYVGKEQKTYQLSVEDVSTTQIADQYGDITTLKKGYVVRLGTDAEGYATIKDENILFKTDKARLDRYPITDEDNRGDLAFLVLWGSWFKTDDELTVTYISKDVLDGTEQGLNEFEDAEQIDGSWYSSAQIFTFDLSSDAKDDFITNNLAEEDYTDVLASLAQYEGDGSTKPAEVFVYADINSVETVIIVKR